MHAVTVLLASAFVGFFAALPIGPVNLLCIRRTLAYGTIYGFLAGLGAAVADGIFAAVVSFGLAWLQDLIAGQRIWLQLIGGALLVFFGYRAFITQPHARDAAGINTRLAGRSSVVGSIASTFALAITNPGTVFGFTTAFSAMSGFTGPLDGIDPLFVVAGVTGGSTLWWLTLATLIGRLHHSISDRTMQLINRISGLVIAGLGVIVLGDVLLIAF
ncbi:MAG TPA: LysE family transporter [Rhizomicrobium sp.]|jgi:threonine/homoserine/homoserine lactone efflux protein|nr:LysE family transporter [Rhizomicrobium sp.]